MDHCTNSARRVCGTAALCLSLLLVPTIVWAQATITGTVKDGSGAVLPGVTVEATSPALIERARTVVTGTPASTGSSTSGPAPTPSRLRFPAFDRQA